MGAEGPIDDPVIKTERERVRHDERGNALSQDAWHNHDARALTVLHACMRGSGKPEIVMTFINGSHAGIAFDFPQIATNWFLLIDSLQKQTDMR